MKNTLYSKNHQHITEQLKKARQESGLGQLEVAKLLKRTQSYVSKLESGQRRIDAVQLQELAKIYKKEINFFI